MSEIPLCPVCGGSGEEVVDSMTAYGIPGGWVAVGPCPNGCVGVALGEFEHVDPDTGEHLGNELIVKNLDPSVVKKWCETHDASVRWPHMDTCYEYRKAHTPCHLIAVRIKKLGELA